MLLKRAILTSHHPLASYIRGVYYLNVLRKIGPDCEPDLLALRNVVHRGARCLDVGANIGVYTKELSALAGPTGKVKAFEPVQETFAALSANVRRLGLRNVEVYNLAISDRQGRVSMSIPIREDGLPNLYRAEICEGQSVECVPLDSLTEPVDFIKIDVEGHEFEVLKGAAELLRCYRPSLLVETQQQSVFSFLADLGYSAYVARAGALRRHCGEEAINYFFVN
jgi:FkbM family methyltransferase